MLAEALERWPQQLMETLLPRVWEIITEIAHRYQKQVENFYHDPAKTAELAIVWDGQVRMANLCIAGGMAVNGVSALHSDILRHDVFRWQLPDGAGEVQERHQRHRPPPLARADQPAARRPDPPTSAAGDGYLLHPEELNASSRPSPAMARCSRGSTQIKRANKLDFAAYVKKDAGRGTQHRRHL